MNMGLGFYKTKNTSITRGLMIKIALVLLILSAIFYTYYNEVEREKPLGMGEDIEIYVPSGASTGDIATILAKENLINYPLLFRVISKNRGNDGLYREGAHILNGSMNYEKMMETLKQDTVNNAVTTFTIPEGYEARQIAEALSQKGLVDKDRFLELVDKGDFNYLFLKDLPKRDNRLEGYLFPDTYEVFVNSSEEEIISKMLDRFEQIFDEEYYLRAEEIGMTVDEVIILASIIEREAMHSDEMAIVSGVFLIMLNSREYYRLESCATVQYILGERKKVLSTRDTKIDSPYNTYMYGGLPVGPIASPGKLSIEAALYPADVEYLFFVADDDGRHIFTKTYEQHLKAIDEINSR